MKLLFTALITLSFAVSSQAATLLSCNVAEKDLKSVVISEGSEGLSGLLMEETFHRGEVKISTIERADFENGRIRLSNGPMGFRHLTYTYSDFFQEFDWFVISQGGTSYSESRANCN